MPPQVKNWEVCSHKARTDRDLKLSGCIYIRIETGDTVFETASQTSNKNGIDKEIIGYPGKIKLMAIKNTVADRPGGRRCTARYKKRSPHVAVPISKRNAAGRPSA